MENRFQAASAARVPPALKARVIEILAREVDISLIGKEDAGVVRACASGVLFRPFKGESNADYFQRICERYPEAKKGVYVGEVVKPFVRDLLHREGFVMRMPSNPRAGYIDTLPHPVSMHGIGNGREDTTQFVRGK